MARSTSGEVIGLSHRVGWVRLPHGSLIDRVQVQMEARLVWNQEAANLRSVPGFDPEVPDLKTVVEGWLPILG